MLKYEGFGEDFQFKLEYIGKIIIFAGFYTRLR